MQDRGARSRFGRAPRVLAQVRCPAEPDLCLHGDLHKKFGDGRSASATSPIVGDVADGEPWYCFKQILDGEIPAFSGQVSLFIDPIGRPLTPLSGAGVARRTTRSPATSGSVWAKTTTIRATPTVLMPRERARPVMAITASRSEFRISFAIKRH